MDAFRRRPVAAHLHTLCTLRSAGTAENLHIRQEQVSDVYFQSITLDQSLYDQERQEHQAGVVPTLRN